MTAVPRLHVAIIMDGNGRWATARGLPRLEGHRQGGRALRRVVEAAPDLGIHALTVYAFSSDNWRRPASEVNGLMMLFAEYLASCEADCVKAGIRVALVGRRDRLPARVARSAARLEAATASGRALLLRLAIDYSARDAIWRAAQRVVRGEHPSRDAFANAVASGGPDSPPVPEVDLLVRTGGERRLSDFLLWESAYAELWFTDTPWPDFTVEELADAVADFGRRERRFGGLPEAQSAGAHSAAGSARPSARP